MDPTWDVLVRVLVAAGLGAAVGAEREWHSKEAGLRTHVSVALGAALVSATFLLGLDSASAEAGSRADFARAIGQVLVAIGFLGAGTIIRERGEAHNLTTAASLWVTTAIGIAAGTGNLVVASLATVMLLAVLVVLRLPATVLRRISPHTEPGKPDDPEKVDDAEPQREPAPGG